MPSDPDWDLEEDSRATPNLPGAEVDYRRSPFEYGADGMRVMDAEEGEQQDDYEEEQEGFEEAEEMEVNLPRPDRSQSSEKDPDATPRNLPFSGAGLGKMAQVEVVLHSSPRRPAFTAPPVEPGGEVVDETNLVISDIVPKPKKRQPDDLAAKAQVASPTTAQAPVAPTPLPTATPQPKKRGRPVGWRLDHGSYSALRQGLPPGTATPRPKPKKPTDEHKPRGRPGRKPAPTARQLYLKLNPHFASFRCEWENCPAELQNLETLRKHLLVVHGRPSSTTTTTPSSPQSSESITCKWAACPSSRFLSLPSFTTHLETAHLLPHLWHAGDGPRNTTPTNNPPPLPPYLFNAQGAQVTPSIATQELENDDDRKKRQARIHRVLALRDQHAPEEPEYTEREKEIIGEVFSAKQARLRMLGAYAEWVGKEEGEGWRVG